MQKNVFSYVLGVAALSLLCSCGTCKKEEVKVDQAPIEQKTEAVKEVAQNEAPVAATTVADATPATATTPVDEPKDEKAAEENKAA